MRVPTGHPRRSRTAGMILLTAPLAALSVACGSAAGISSSGGPGGSGAGGGTSGGGTSGGAASCAYFTQPDYLAMARVVFVGTMLPGRTVNGLLVSPARVRVTRYIKGSGPAVVTVQTAVSHSGSTGDAEGITARSGQTWQIYTTSRHLPFETGVCSGSRLTGGSAATP